MLTSRQRHRDVVILHPRRTGVSVESEGKVDSGDDGEIASQRGAQQSKQ
jgi:hypothetical protein